MVYRDGMKCGSSGGKKETEKKLSAGEEENQ